MLLCVICTTVNGRGEILPFHPYTQYNLYHFLSFPFPLFPFLSSQRAVAEERVVEGEAGEAVLAETREALVTQTRATEELEEIRRTLSVKLIVEQKESLKRLGAIEDLQCVYIIVE